MRQYLMRFPFFNMLSNFVNKDLKKVDDFVVLLRIVPRITASDYTSIILWLLFLACVIFILILSWISFVIDNGVVTLDRSGTIKVRRTDTDDEPIPSKMSQSGL